ncbi:RagB/SusD family nutrient uptake outer membrane protein [Puteibacter caeruleilacunae]|nr:RagB/SusD family nutrient uptake outer membrane protein [Puteibacter caeruleilacunae]
MIRKNIFIYAMLLFTALACKENLLDTSPYGSKYEEALVWSNRANADAFVHKTYNDILNQYSGYAGIENWTTNGVHNQGHEGVPREDYTRESDFGFNKFGLIRRCNLIIEKAAASETLADGDKTELVAEGKFLRGMIYFHQARRFGRVVWVDRVLTEDEETYKLPLTANVGETYNHIISDLDDAIAGLPETALAGKASKYAAAAIKSEVCLQAAAYTGNDSYYQEAIDAANLVINEGGFSLENDYGTMFDERNRFSNEIILGLYRDKENNNCNNVEDLQWCVPNVSNDVLNRNGGSPLFKSDIQVFEAWNQHVPTQTLVDNYLVTDEQTGEALRWDQTSQFAENLELIGDREWRVKAGIDLDINDIIYENADNRLNASIVHDRSSWFGEDIATRIKGNLNRKIDGGARNWVMSVTNYYWRKGTYTVTPRVYVGIPTDYHWVITRLGRVYMNKAEALLRQNKVAEAVATLNVTRVGHGGLAPSTATSLADAWTDYKRERRVELAKERDYYWTLLRWGKYGGEANHGRAAGGVIYELKDEMPGLIVIAQDRKSFYVRTFADNGENYNNIEKREFTAERRYFFPIPKGVRDRNENLDQNPGW